MTRVSDGDFRRALQELARAAGALERYRERLVVAGGMVPLLYRMAGRYADTELPAIATTECDIVALRTVTTKDEPTIPALLHTASFVAFEAPGYRGKPGAQYFQDAAYGNKRAPTYLEVLTPHKGSSEAEFMQLQPGLRAQRLKYLDLLEFRCFDVHLAMGVAESIVRVPHPALFIAQKILSRKSGRSPLKRAKDLAYVYDVVLLTRDVWPELAGTLDAAAESAQQRWPSWIRQARQLLRELWSAPTAEGCVAVATVLRDAAPRSAPSPEVVWRVMQSFAAVVSPSTTPRGAGRRRT